MLAIIQTGGKQFCLTAGKKAIVPRLQAKVGETLTLPDILHNTSVTAEVVEHVVADKVVTRKFRNKTRYQRTKGHRQPMTVIMIRDSKATEKPDEAKTSTKAAKTASTKKAAA
jgi:large subunit ribosomal protein L21